MSFCNENNLILEQAMYGDDAVDTVKNWLQTRPNVDCRLNEDGDSALIIAATWGSAEKVGLLIEAGANVDFQSDSDGETALMRVLKRNKTMEEVDLLLKAGANVDIQEKTGKTALSFAVLSKNLKCVELLALKSTNIDSQDSKGKTALIEGIFSTKVVEILLTSKADINKQDNSGNSPLLNAVEHGFFEVVKKLLESSADVDLKDKDGETALIRAASLGYFEIVDELLKNNSKLDEQLKNGLTALMCSIRSWPGVNDAKNYRKITKALIKAGANVDLKDEDGLTALSWAALESSFEAVEVLLDGCCDVNLQDKEGDTALHLACGRLGDSQVYDNKETIKIVLILVENGADVRLRNFEQELPRCNDDAFEELDGFLGRLRNEPGTLQHLCRFVVLKSIKCQDSKTAAIQSLPLPLELIDFIRRPVFNVSVYIPVEEASVSDDTSEGSFVVDPDERNRVRYMYG